MLCFVTHGYGCAQSKCSAVQIEFQRKGSPWKYFIIFQCSQSVTKGSINGFSAKATLVGCFLVLRKPFWFDFILWCGCYCSSLRGRLKNGSERRRLRKSRKGKREGSLILVSPIPSLLPFPPPPPQSPFPFDASYAGSRENEVSVYLSFCIKSFGDSTRLQHQESTL